MKLIKTNLSTYNNLTGASTVYGRMSLLVSDKFQIGFKRGKFKVRVLSTCKDYYEYADSYFFNNLKEAVIFAKSLN